MASRGQFRGVGVGVAVGLIAAAALVVGGGLGKGEPAPGSDDAGASATPTGLVEPSGSADPAGAAAMPKPLPEQAPVAKGKARADDAAGNLIGQIARSTTPGKLGAVEAFVSYATWAMASPAAEKEATLASESFGSLNFADANMLSGFNRTGGVAFVPSKGAYRTLGFSGPEAKPDQVMIEVAAPLAVRGKLRWMVVGGVVAWIDGRWELTSLRPREIAQPSAATQDATNMSASDQTRVLKGVGWTLFGNGPAKR